MTEKNTLHEIVSALMQRGKGLLAADESDSTAGKRLDVAGLPNQPGNRQDFREILFTAPGIEEYLSGVILFPSTLTENTDMGVPFADVLAARGILPGVKVDLGVRELHLGTKETYTAGLDALDDRLQMYYRNGARFAKWRSVITIDENLPSDIALKTNAVQTALYAQAVQAANMVPIIEPEVLFEGSHSLEKAEAVTTRTLQVFFSVLREYTIDLRALILKSSMVLAGSENKQQSTPEEVASATLRTFQLSVPREVGGIVFLSGGQSSKRATENLQAIAAFGQQAWPISFSYSRALEEPVLLAWQGKPENIPVAQKALLYRCKMNSLAQLGKYESERDVK